MDGMRLTKDGGEILDYSDPAMPVQSCTHRIRDFKEGFCPYHWHEELEFFVALQGGAYYTVNGRRLEFAQGDGIFVNARQLHASGAEEGEAGLFYCLCFTAELLHCGEGFFRRYVEPVAQHGPAAVLLRRADPQQARCLDALHAIRALGEEELPALTVAAQLFALWEAFAPVALPLVSDVPPRDAEDLAVQKRMVHYIYSNYPRRVTLTDIAAAGNVSRSKCCTLFRRYLRQSPVEFLNQYRLTCAEEQLRGTERSITEIALDCGFNSPSYFAESFTRLRGCTPSAYRARQPGREGC